MHCVSTNDNKTITPDERKRIISNFVGYDISPDMVRLSLVNLYLHGFSDPHISEYDTLSSEERWDENFDVILANPPFMSPKGGIRPHKRFTVSSNRSEVLFVDYIAEHLNPKGRAGVIVPEGVIFQSGTAYKELRKMLVENYLYAVVSLPAGIFNPYSGVKTSILLMDKEIAKSCNEILFVKIDNDGYNLGAQRNAVKGGQLEEAIKLIHDFVSSVNADGNGDAIVETQCIGNANIIGNRVATDVETQCIASLPHPTTTPTPNPQYADIAHAVPKTEIAKNGDYNLSGERYKTALKHNSTYNFAKLVDITSQITDGTHQTPAYTNSGVPFFRVTDLTLSNDSKKFISLGEHHELIKRCRPEKGDVLYSKNGTIGVAKLINWDFEFSIFVSLALLKPIKEKIIPKYLEVLLNSEQTLVRAKGFSKSGTVTNLHLIDIKQIQIPLPPLSVQQEIVAEIEGYQKIIDGAKMVVENYKPKITIDPAWEMAELGKISEIISGYGFDSKDFTEDNPVKCIKITNVGVREFVDDDSSRLPTNYLKDFARYKVNENDLVISLTRTIISAGLKVAVVPRTWDNTLVNQRVAGIKPNGKSNINYIYYYLCSEAVYSYVEEKSRSLMQPNQSVTDLKILPVPCPSIETQHEIVSQIEKEQKLINASKQLVEIFEQKIKDRIAKVWGA